MDKLVIFILLLCVLVLPLVLAACSNSPAGTRQPQQIVQNLPPRHFYDRAELNIWRQSVGIVGVNMNYVDGIMQLQQIALEDGYIVSIDLDWDESTDYWGVSLTALAGDGFYVIYPDDLTVTWFCQVQW